MKKIFAILTIASVMVACNNSTEATTETTSVDTTIVTEISTDTTVVTTDSTAAVVAPATEAPAAH